MKYFMKSVVFTIVHILALLLSYVALGVGLLWLTKIELPLPTVIDSSIYIAVGAFVMLPILAFVCIRFGKILVTLILGWVYAFFWAILIFRFLFIIFNR